MVNKVRLRRRDCGIESQEKLDCLDRETHTHAHTICPQTAATTTLPLDLTVANNAEL